MAKAKLKDAIKCAVKNGSFGESIELVDVVPSDLKGEDHFASEVIFAKVIITNNGKEDKSVSIVVKNQPDDPNRRRFMSTHIQFYNELIMYKDILPYLDINNHLIKTMFPKFFYGVATLGENFDDDIMVIEDLQTSEFKLTKDRIFLDIAHCKLALAKLGKFHALSYLAKQHDIEQFNSKVKQLKEDRPNSDADSDFFSLTFIERSISPLDIEDELKSQLNLLRENTKKPTELRMKLVQPSEPLAVLCHGDFCRNNMLFRYNKDGLPEDVRFFDVATARYASPAIDLSFFMLMNTTTELRSSHWDDLLTTYHVALTSAAPGCSVPSLDRMRQEIRDKALYGYLLSSFFIPMMVDAETKGKEDFSKEREDFSKMTVEEKYQGLMLMGGEKATKYTSDIVRDLIKFECIPKACS